MYLSSPGNAAMFSPNATISNPKSQSALQRSNAQGFPGALALHAKGIETVMITLGAKGVWVSRNGEGELIAGFRVEATDTTAAGDTFNGALVTGLLEDMPMECAIKFAHAAAAISVTRFGAQTSIPSRAETDAFLTEQLSA